MQRRSAAIRLAPEPRPATSAESRLHSPVLLAVFDRRPDEQSADDDGRQDDDEENCNDRGRGVHRLSYGTCIRSSKCWFRFGCSRRADAVNATESSTRWPVQAGSRDARRNGRARGTAIVAIGRECNFGTRPWSAAPGRRSRGGRPRVSRRAREDLRRAQLHHPRPVRRRVNHLQASAAGHD